jgi:hypothetical protein
MVLSTFITAGLRTPSHSKLLVVLLSKMPSLFILTFLFIVTILFYFMELTFRYRFSLVFSPISWATVSEVAATFLPRHVQHSAIYCSLCLSFKN